MSEENMTEIIIDGGEPLPGCPKSFNEANKWADNANENKGEFHEPRWSFDCGFKLDFDGPLIDINSRFYPPKKHYGEGWDGTITILVMGKEFIEQQIEAKSLDELKIKAEKFVNELAETPTIERLLIHNKKKTADKFIEVVGRKLHFFEKMDEANTKPLTAKEVNELHDGWLHRYQNDFLFRNKVESTVAELVRSLDTNY